MKRYREGEQLVRINLANSLSFGDYQ